MGKQASKHVCRTRDRTEAECFLNSQINKALEEQIWKSKTGFNLANYNMDNSISELSISLEEKPDNIPLRVELPPQKMETDTAKILMFDQDELDKKDEKLKGDNKEADSRLNIEDICGLYGSAHLIPHDNIYKILQWKDSLVKKYGELPGIREYHDFQAFFTEDGIVKKIRRACFQGEWQPSPQAEFECGVQFEGSENNKQEWAFTLYDFDGHGKITKEDLASLLKALYDAVGSSIKIPSNGTKSLKLRLTVGQDGSQVTGEKSSKVKDNSKNKFSKSKESQKVKEFSKLNNLTQANVQLPAKHNNETQGQSQQQGQGCSKRIQLTSQEQQQLAELVQENMERNHVKQLRRHHSDCRGLGAHDHSHHKRRHRGHCTKNNIESVTINNNLAAENNSEEKPKECQDRRNYYLDLAGIENFNSKFASCTSNAIGKGQSQEAGAGHHRSRSHDINQNSENLKRESDRLTKTENVESGAKLDHLRSRSFDAQEPAARSPKGHAKISASSHTRHGKFRPVSLPVHVPETVSPHYHRRHRHREKDHDLAMQQVAEWIEREHSCEVDGDHVIVQRHEHHHIHEHHHHHHYHHYYEA